MVESSREHQLTVDRSIDSVFLSSSQRYRPFDYWQCTTTQCTSYQGTGGWDAPWVHRAASQRQYSTDQLGSILGAVDNLRGSAYRMQAQNLSSKCSFMKQQPPRPSHSIRSCMQDSRACLVVLQQLLLQLHWCVRPWSSHQTPYLQQTASR